MLFTVAAATLLGAAAATPIGHNFPPRDSSKGFHIMVNVTDLSRDLPNSVHKKFLTSLHTGAGTSIVGVAGDDLGPVFYNNGTADDKALGRGTIAADLGTPGIPFGLSLPIYPDSKDSSAHTAFLNAGPSTEYIHTLSYPDPVSIVEIATVGICPMTLPSGEEYPVLRQFYVGNSNKWIPKECAPAKLLVQCAELKASPQADHTYAQETNCYTDAAAINWANYDAFRPGE